MKKERAHSNQIDTKAKEGIYNNYNRNELIKKNESTKHIPEYKAKPKFFTLC